MLILQSSQWSRWKYSPDHFCERRAVQDSLSIALPPVSAGTSSCSEEIKFDSEILYVEFVLLGYVPVTFSTTKIVC